VLKLVRDGGGKEKGEVRLFLYVFLVRLALRLNLVTRSSQASHYPHIDTL
jgi:hypothetical protein